MVGRAVATIVWSIAAKSMPSMIPEKTMSTWRRGSPTAVGAAADSGDVTSMRFLLAARGAGLRHSRQNCRMCNFAGGAGIPLAGRAAPAPRPGPRNRGSGRGARARRGTGPDPPARFLAHLLQGRPRRHPEALRAPGEVGHLATARWQVADRPRGVGQKVPGMFALAPLVSSTRLTLVN